MTRIVLVRIQLFFPAFYNASDLDPHLSPRDSFMHAIRLQPRSGKCAL
jgi:hypothetical protein